MITFVSIIRFKIILFFLIFTLIDAEQSYEIATCSTESLNDVSHILNYTLKSDSIMFFQSPNFPQTIYNTSTANFRCKSVFYAENQNQKIWLAMLFGKADIFLSEDLVSECYTDSDCFIEYNSNFNIFTFAINNDMLKFEVKEENNFEIWKAFQAALVSYDSSTANNTCPLSNQTFNFNDTTDLTVPLVSSFYQLNNGTAKKACSWTFTINPTQSLKVVVKNLTIQNNENSFVSLHDDNTTIKNFTDNILDKVFYYNGTSFTFNFFNEYNSNTSFFILVSAVQKVVNFTSDSCNSYNNSQSATFLNINNIKGYPANQYCDNTLIIPKNYEGVLYFYENNYEFCCDTLSLKYGTNQSYLLGIEKEFPLIYKFTRDVNGGHLIFQSDGNTQGAGYKSVFETFECECADRHLLTSCDETGDYIYPMKKDNENYCSNMFCEYQIVPNALCPDYYIMIQIDTKLNNETDELRLLANGSTVIIPPKGKSYMYYPPRTNLFLILESGEPLLPISKNDKSFFGMVDSIKPPNFTKINLDQENPKYLLWLNDAKKGDAITVCTTESILEIFVSNEWYAVNGENEEDYFYLKQYQLFDGSDMMKSFVGTLAVESDALVSTSTSRPRSRKSTSGCFTIFASKGTLENQHSVLFKASHGNSCKNTVYQIPSDDMTTTFDANILSDASETCEYIFFAGTKSRREDLPFIWIHNISTNLNTSLTFLSTINKNELFKINDTEATQWQNIGIYTPALSVIVPPSTNLTIHFSNVYPLQPHHNAENSQQKGIMASPSYCGFMDTFFGSKLYNFQFADTANVELNFIKFYGNSFPVLEIAEGNKTLNQNITFDTNKFSIYYNENDARNNGFLIEYIIVPYITSTTSKSTTEITNEIYTSTNDRQTSTKSIIVENTSNTFTPIPNVMSSTKINREFLTTIPDLQTSTNSIIINITTTKVPDTPETTTITTTAAPETNGKPDALNFFIFLTFIFFTFLIRH